MRMVGSHASPTQPRTQLAPYRPCRRHHLRGIGVRVLEQGIDTATADGQAMFAMGTVKLLKMSDLR